MSDRIDAESVETVGLFPGLRAFAISTRANYLAVDDFGGGIRTVLPQLIATNFNRYPCCMGSVQFTEFPSSPTYRFMTRTTRYMN